MIVGRRPLERLSRAVRCGIAAAALALLAAGCGGGGGGGEEIPAPTNAIITGRVVEGITDQGVGGVSVSYAGTTVQTDGAGLFRIEIANPNRVDILRVQGTGFYGSGQYNGVTIRLNTDGIPIPAVQSGQPFNVGTIEVFSTEGPPPPPSL